MENVQPLQTYIFFKKNIVIVMGNTSTYELTLFVLEKDDFEQLDHNSPKKKSLMK
ncbi:hypothetical protein BP39_01 [Staphylococcus phage BP39]|uniref:Uncharacterized protein n=1 Tax=Staphylococcus phage BP39 TaxID=1543206 RepID=A0A185AMV6_9CAUD|nr:hypothetical protein BIZ97_gp01 [Staphylococcus phage BP39]AIT13802.1 hypothetical protein BP39_01 [Staphylococcus phage BP39]